MPCALTPCLGRLALGTAVLFAASCRPALCAPLDDCRDGDDACEAEDVAPLLQTRRVGAERPASARPAQLAIGAEALQEQPGDAAAGWPSAPKPRDGPALVAAPGDARVHRHSPHGSTQADGWNAMVGFVGLGLLGVGLQVMMAECILLDHGGLCSCCLLPLRLLRHAQGQIRTLVGRWWSHLASLRYTMCCCSWSLRTSAGEEALLKKESPMVKHLPLPEVASWLSAPELFRLGAASRELRRLPDEVCSPSQLLAEVQRLDLEREWLRELALGGDAGQPASSKDPGSGSAPDPVQPDKVPIATLRRFLVQQSLRLDEEEQASLAARRMQAYCDLARFLLLAICWAAFLCEVVKLAAAGKDHSAFLAVKALASPFLFLYVLENYELRPGRCVAVTCVAIALLYECLHDTRFHIAWRALPQASALMKPQHTANPI